MSQDSLHALWVNPLAFDPDVHGPPYLPEKPTVKMASGGESALMLLMPRMPDGASGVELGVLTGVLQAAAQVHQSHHWQTRGPNYYSDHLLFERLYSESVPFVDQVAERAVGLGGVALVSPFLQASLVQVLMALWGLESASAPLDFVAVSLEVERCLVDCIEEVRATMEDRGALTSGTDNLLQGIADKHEELIYLLQQRAGDTYSYDRA